MSCKGFPHVDGNGVVGVYQEDHETQVAQLEAEIERLNAELDEQKAQIQKLLEWYAFYLIMSSLL